MSIRTVTYGKAKGYVALLIAARKLMKHLNKFNH